MEAAREEAAFRADSAELQALADGAEARRRACVERLARSAFAGASESSQRECFAAWWSAVVERRSRDAEAGRTLRRAEQLSRLGEFMSGVASSGSSVLFHLAFVLWREDARQEGSARRSREAKVEVGQRVSAMLVTALMLYLH